MSKTNESTEAPRPTSRLLSDGVASVVVFLVALPLCMGIAIASGVPPARGLLTGIIGGLVVGLLAGSPLQVSGPAAGLTVMVVGLVERFGLEMLGPIVLLAGLFQMIAGAVRAGRWFRAVPPSLVYGMLAGIGLLIVGSQFHVMVGDAPRGSGLANLAAVPTAALKIIAPPAGSTAMAAGAIGIVTIVVLVLWNRLPAGRLRMIPGPLVAVLVATGAAAALRLPIAYVDLPEDMIGATTLTGWGAMGRLLDPTIIGSALALAVIASAETLLCAAAVDRMHGGPRTRYNRELWAQGVGNTLCGLIGALPMTGVIVRSSANVQAGGKTRLSAILHGAWLLLLVVLAPGLLQAIPIANLAAILVFTGFKLVNLNVLKTLRPFGRGEIAIFVATVVGIVATDLLKGVGIGLLFALGRLLYHFTRLDIRVEDDPERNTTRVHLKGSASFLRVPDLAAVLESVAPTRHLHVEARELDYIDHASVVTLSDWEKQHRGQGGRASIRWPADPGEAA